MKIVLSLICLIISLLALAFLGVAGVNQLIAGLTEEPKDWGDIIWGFIRAWLALPVMIWSFVGCIAFLALDD